MPPGSFGKLNGKLNGIFPRSRDKQEDAPKPAPQQQENDDRQQKQNVQSHQEQEKAAGSASASISGSSAAPKAALDPWAAITARAKQRYLEKKEREKKSLPKMMKEQQEKKQAMLERQQEEIRKPKPPALEKVSKEDLFLRSETFAGEKPGYVFTTHMLHGTGYYHKSFFDISLETHLTNMEAESRANWKESYLVRKPNADEEDPLDPANWCGAKRGTSYGYGMGWGRSADTDKDYRMGQTGRYGKSHIQPHLIHADPRFSNNMEDKIGIALGHKITSRKQWEGIQHSRMMQSGVDVYEEADMHERAVKRLQEKAERYRKNQGKALYQSYKPPPKIPIPSRPPPATKKRRMSDMFGENYVPAGVSGNAPEDAFGGLNE